jgi:putative FmdB family regulatory protein
MPTYEYKCAACGAKFEKFQSITAPAIRKCPVCGKNRVKRLIGTGAGLIFKGGGFYETDYRSESYKNAAKADSGNATPAKEGGKEAAKPEGGKTETPPKSEPKPATKPAAESKPAGGEKSRADK